MRYDEKKNYNILIKIKKGETYVSPFLWVHLITYYLLILRTS